MPSVYSCPVCVPCVSRLPPGPSYRYCTGTVVCVVRVPLCASACPVRVSRPCVPAPPGRCLYTGTVPGVCPGLPTVSYRVPVRYRVQCQYTFY
jgi:hypothetical protein